MRASKILAFSLVFFVVVLMAASPVRTVEATGNIPVYLASGKLMANTHEVTGRVIGTSPVEVQLTGHAQYANASTYFCLASGADESQTLGPQVVNVTGGRFRILHGSAEPAAVAYRCIGM